MNLGFGIWDFAASLMGIWDFTTTHLQIFLLVLARVAGVFAFAPVFSAAQVPVQVKAWLSAFIALALTPIIGHNVAWAQTLSNPMTFGAALLVQSVVGMVMGFAASLVFAAVQMAGEFMGIEIGFAIATVFNPLENAAGSLLANLKHWFAVLLFLALNGHHTLLLAVGASFRLMPLSASAWTPTMMAGVESLFVRTTLIAVTIALPVVGTMVLAEVALGVLARTMPQMNVLIVGFPLKIGAGLFALALSLPFFAVVLERLFNEMPRQILGLIK